MTDESVFAAALALPDPAARAAYLDRACAGNPALRAEVEALLGAHAGSNPLDRPAANLAFTGAYESAHDADPAEAVGAVIGGRYKLLEALGAGGMGAVYMAQQTEPVKRLVAVKVIKAGMDSRQVLARFEAERQALAMMDHPNIAKVLDAGTTDAGRPFFVMELVKGVPITKFCDDRKLSPRERLELFVPVCQAIQHAHQKGIIHRDIKPGNVLVALYDGRPVPKVIDFGVAKAAGQPLTDLTLVTGFGAVVGTPEYMSPEQAELNQLDIDTRSDVFALGVLLYELLTGTTPLDRKRLGQAALLEILRIVREEEPPKPSTRISTSGALAGIAASRNTDPARLSRLMKGELDWIVMRCLEKDRNRRYDTATALARDIERHLKGDAVEACPPTLGYRLKKAYRKNRGPLTAAALVLLALVGGIIGTTVGLFRAEAAKEAEGRERVRAEQERDDKERARAEVDDQRKKAENQAASIGIDLDMEGAEPKIELLRLARRLPTIPEHAHELREFVIRRMLCLGQKIRPLVEAGAELSPDGRFVLTTRYGVSVLREVQSGRQIALWRGRGRFVAGGRLILVDEDEAPRKRLRLCDTTGRVVMTSESLPRGATFVEVSPDGKRVLLESVAYREGRRCWAGLYLLDGESGKLLGELPGHREAIVLAPFNPDGATLLTAAEGLIRVWNQDGGLIKELGRYPDLVDMSFSPSGRIIAALEGTRLHRWRVGTWVEDGPPIPVPSASQKKLRWLDDETVGVTSYVSVGLGDTSPETFIPGHGTVPAGDLRIKGNLAYSASGSLFDLRTGRRIPAPRERRFPPEVAQFAIDRRLLVANSKLYDLRVEKVVAEIGWEPQNSIADHFLWLRFYEGIGSPTGLGIPLNPLPSPGYMPLWAAVAARGELDESGEFIPWDEKKWEGQRQALLRVAAEESSVFLGPALHDPLYWLREALDSSNRMVPDAAPMPLFNRLVADEPSWENYFRRAKAHEQAGQWDLALLDFFEASRRAGLWIDPYQYDNGSPSWRISMTPGHSRELYELVLRWTEARRDAGIGVDSDAIAACLYRLGRYADALAELRKAEEKAFPAQIGRVVLTNSLVATVPLHGITALAHPGNQLPTLHEWSFPALRAMCHHKLGQPALAQKHLTAVAAAQKAEDEIPPGFGPRLIRPDLFLYREAVEVITGKPPPHEPKK